MLHYTLLLIPYISLHTHRPPPHEVSLAMSSLGLTHQPLAKLKRLLVILMLIRIIRSPRVSPCPNPTPGVIYYTTISPLLLHAPLPCLDSEGAMTMSMSSPKPTRDQLKRVLSHGSNDAIGTPTGNGHTPLSPSSGGVRTPRPAMADLPDKKDGEKLATDLHQLKVQSPTPGHETLPPITQSFDSAVGADIPVAQHHRQASNNSTSTESGSSINHPVAPSSLGTSYGPEGFLRTTTPGEENNGVDPYMSAQAMAAVAAADEAIKQINGTSTVRQAPSMSAIGAENPFQLPRGYANFVNPQYRDKPQSPPDYSASRQSSTSSSTTEASTSSEESDLCIPTIEWVNTKPNLVPPQGHQSPYQFTPYMPNAVPQMRPSPVPPPRQHPLATSSKATSSPRRPSGTNGHGNGESRPTLPLGATAHSPTGTSSAMPLGMSHEEPAEDDDDEQTVGQKRSRSRSHSTSSESGLDLLSHVASGNRLGETSSGGQAHEGKGKRKAGSKAVAQWREGGIPTGIDKKSGIRRSSGTGVKVKAEATPPRKRRRSEMSDANIDPSLRSEGPPDRHDDSAMDLEEYEPGSGDSEGDVDDEEANSGDSEYGTSRIKPKTVGRGRGGRKSGVTRGRASIGGGTTKAGGTKKTKKATTGSPAGSNRRASAGAGGGGGQTVPGGVQCEYINPLPVSRLLLSHLTPQICLILIDLLSHTIAVPIYSRGNMTCHDTWPVTLDEKASSSLKASWPKIAQHSGGQSRTSRK